VQDFTHLTESRRPLARDLVFHCLADDIAELRLRPGGSISAANLEDEFDVSRTPIREALIRLSHLGLVEFSPGSSTRAAQICLRAQKQRALTAAALVIATVRDAFAHVSTGHLDQLRQHTDDVRRTAGTKGEAAHWWMLAQAIVAAGGNLIMRELFEVNLGLHLRRSLDDVEIPAAMSRELLQHADKMMNAMALGDGHTAATHVAAAIHVACGDADTAPCSSRWACLQCE